MTNDGVALTLQVAAGLCATGRIASARADAPGREVWFGYYDARILANHWEPHDQPHPCAYLPWSWMDLDKLDVGTQGSFVVQRRPTVAGRTTRALATEYTDPSDPRLVRAIEEALTAAGVPCQATARCVDEIMRRIGHAQAAP